MLNVTLAIQVLTVTVTVLGSQKISLYAFVTLSVDFQYGEVHFKTKESVTLTGVSL